ncbi:enediyne biosynthesis protein UnbU [Saccharothrix sp. HUAS TT1]|uniref:enediyne biosynthesis protein UnbU n=1 Tax=unclassified Saccharothrix TaxID=2593673 RepID=UPI00345B7723
MTATRLAGAGPDERALAAPGGPGLTADQRRVKALTRFAVSITAFNVLGHLFLGFEQAPITPVVAVLTSYAAALAFEALDAWAFGRRAEFTKGRRAFAVFLLPAHITGLATGMLMWGNASLWPYVFAILVGNGSKYLVRLRVRGRLRHVLNPSNTGIAVALLLFPWVSIAPPYHFTSSTTGAIDWLLPLAVLAAGTVINVKLTGRMPLIAGWLGGFAAQALVRWLLLDHHLLAALAPMTGLAFILFTNYMITDPATTPTRGRDQVAFGVAVAAVYGVLVVSGVSFGLFFALVITCGARFLVQLLRPRVRATP